MITCSCSRLFHYVRDDFIIFSGGMPRANCSDKNTVAVLNGDGKQVVFDFTSKIVDFFTISDNDQECGESLKLLLRWCL